MKIQTIRPICGHVYFVDGENASHLSDLPCTRCAGRGYPVEYRSRIYIQVTPAYTVGRKSTASTRAPTTATA